MKRYKLTIAYEGTAYSGWQIQKNSLSIQSLIQKALETFLREATPLSGSGRTDAGVHAKGQVAHFDSSVNFSLPLFIRSVNALLPSDICVLKIEPVPLDFHSRYSAASKSYSYFLHLDPVIEPFYRKFRLHVRFPLNLTEIEKGISLLKGTHDFSAFSNKNDRGCVAYDPIRTLSQLDMVKTEGGIRFDFTSDGFLYKMVRNITGTLLEIGTGRLAFKKIPEIFEKKNRSLAGKTAPPHGLFLIKVHYPLSFSEENNR